MGVIVILRDIFLYRESKKRRFTIGESYGKKAVDTSQKLKIYDNVDKNKEYIEKLYNMPNNADVVIRDFSFTINGKTVRSLIVTVDGLSSGESINQCILKPLMRLYNKEIECSVEAIKRELIPQVQMSVSDDLNDMAEKINIGNAILFFDGFTQGLIADVKTWEHKGVDTPQNETVIQGPNESFNGVLRTNTALIRKTLNNHNVTVENFTVGKTSKTPGSLVYMSNVVNTTLLNEVRFRLNNIDAQYVMSVLDIEKYIEDEAYIPVPQMLTTERPDRVADSIIDGKIAIVLNGSPNVLVLPVTVFDLSRSSEDRYLRYPYSAFISVIRMFAIFISLLTPAVFVAVCQYHRELLVTPLMLAIQSSRLSVPFSIIGELLLMELAFELIKEAGVRIPGPIGSTIGIVGGLILGQSAVEANIVSPIMIIVVAICGLASFAIPSYTFSFSLRFLRFIYIFAAAIGGVLGICILLFINVVLYSKTLSFGVEVTYPISKRREQAVKKFFTPPLWKENFRPNEAKPTDKADKGFISRKWKY